MVLRRIGAVALLALFLGWPLLTLAQTNEPATPTPVPTVPAAAPASPAPTATAVAIPGRPPTHTILAGETLVTIAQQYSVTVEALQLVNDISDPELIFAGQILVIPGEMGDEVPTTYVVRAGDTLAAIAARFNTEPAEIARANNLVGPGFLYSGLRLSLISRTGTPNPLSLTGQPVVAAPGEGLSEIALRAGVTIEGLRQANGLSPDEVLFPGQRLRVPAEEIPFQPGLPGEWVAIELDPAAPRQGDTVVLTIAHATPGQPEGRLIGPDGREQPLQFFAAAEANRFHALFGFDAFSQPGRYRIELQGSGPARPWFPLDQAVGLANIDYGLQAITLSESFAPLLAPEVRTAEDAYLDEVFKASALEPLWSGLFQQPVGNAFVTAGYGSDRTYNGGDIVTFHTGIDFGGSVGTPIQAPAPGRVVLVETLELRGLTLVIDHGAGVMSAYYHLSEAGVAVGDVVTAGQTIAAGGNTGLSTGPHLHWDVRVWGAAVDPAAWLQRAFP